MTHSEMTNGLEMHWIEVADGAGRTHLEARWLTAAEHLAPTITHAA